jgi:hypothetical protein
MNTRIAQGKRNGNSRNTSINNSK